MTYRFYRQLSKLSFGDLSIIHKALFLSGTPREERTRWLVYLSTATPPYEDDAIRLLYRLIVEAPSPYLGNVKAELIAAIQQEFKNRGL